MSYSVGQVSAFAGVTVRTLHHYDKAGLLSPSDRSDAGYRLYGDADPVRLQQILFYRELGFSLDEIASMLKAPFPTALDHLRARQRQLTPQERFEVFGEITFDLSYATEAELKWARSDGQREAMARAAAHTMEDWRQLMGEAAAWRAELRAAFDEGEPSDGERAMDLAEEHRLHVSRWFTSCPPDMHRRIADDFVADPRAFALVVPPSQQRPGLAAYTCRAVHANAARHTTGRTDSEEHR
ncbi:MerR family transcriptional regulator [Streptomyces sp. NPDC051133]|uniref:MerR family transcriptional regulator n=1 Tax=Streptomyces sp. NPDC051133 TaxID=3155521 RepID=UPI00344ADABE